MTCAVDWELQANNLSITHAHEVAMHASFTLFDDSTVVHRGDG